MVNSPDLTGFRSGPRRAPRPCPAGPLPCRWRSWMRRRGTCRSIWVNDAFERVTGYGVQEARRRQDAILEDSALQPPDLRPRSARRARARGREIAHTLILRRADGSRLACRAHLSPVRAGGDGPLTHWVVALQDLTEQLSHDAEQADAGGGGAPRAAQPRAHRAGLGPPDGRRRPARAAGDRRRSCGGPSSAGRRSTSTTVGCGWPTGSSRGARPPGRGARHGDAPRRRPRGQDAVQHAARRPERPPGRAALARLVRDRERVGVARAQRRRASCGPSPPTTRTHRSRRTGRRSSSRCPAAVACSGCSSCTRRRRAARARSRPRAPSWT